MSSRKIAFLAMAAAIASNEFVASGFATISPATLPRNGPSSTTTTSLTRRSTQLSATTTTSTRKSINAVFHRYASLSIFAASLLVSGPSLADEVGVEKDAPTLYTGETVEICTKRGPLGACLKTEIRTDTNDNDVSKKYFRDPSDLIKQKVVSRESGSAAANGNSDDGNALIQKLRQQSIDNQEKNELYVARKTFEADQAATFGPFDRQVLIMNTDGRTFTLLESPVAMRLKKAGFIDDKRSFKKQPTPEEISAAQTAQEEGGFFSSIFGK